jgi:hypothetical protein
VKSAPSRSPARTIASRFRTCVTTCASTSPRSAFVTDQPTSGELTHSGLHDDAINNTRGRRDGAVNGASI